MIKIRYEFQTAEGVYRDELWLEDDHQLQEADIEAIKQDRLQKWLITLPENRPTWLKDT